MREKISRPITTGNVAAGLGGKEGAGRAASFGGSSRALPPEKVRADARFFGGLARVRAKTALG